jgi:hypothetical protein
MNDFHSLQQPSLGAVERPTKCFSKIDKMLFKRKEAYATAVLLN